jgi:Dimerisation domain
MSTQDPSRPPVAIPPQAVLLQMATGYWVSQAIAVATKLSLPDLLKDGPKSSSELAATTGTHEPSLYRLLRALNQTTEHSYTQAASCESAASEFSAVLRASTAAVTSGV